MESLLEFIQSNPDPRELKRALAVKMTFTGYKHWEIGKILGASSGFISKWKQVFVEQGIAGLSLGYKGSLGYLSPSQKQEVIAWLKTKAYWNLEKLEYYVAHHYDVVFKSKQSYYELFQAASISWKKSQKKNPRHDPELVAEKKRNHSSSRRATHRDRCRRISGVLGG